MCDQPTFPKQRRLQHGLERGAAKNEALGTSMVKLESLYCGQVRVCPWLRVGFLRLLSGRLLLRQNTRDVDSYRRSRLSVFRFEGRLDIEAEAPIAEGQRTNSVLRLPLALN